MTCTQCKLELPVYAVVCPQCGAAVSSGTSAYYSYLPADTPAWPRDPREASGPSLLVNSAAVQNAAATSAAQARPGSRPNRWLTAIAVLLLSCLLGAGFTVGLLWVHGYFAPKAPVRSVRLPSQAPAATATAGTQNSTTNVLPTPSSFKPLSNASSQSLGLTLSLPQDWVEGQLNTSTSGVKTLTLDPPQSLSVPLSLLIVQFPSDANQAFPSAHDLDQFLIQNFAQATSLSNPQALTNTPQTRTVGGQDWSEDDVSFPLNNNQSLHLVTLSVMYKQHYYSLQFYASNDVFDEAMQKYYNPMLDSLHFTA
ncbi:hypothetical protein [Thermogemmatispora tikiterensis]|uniref:Uncharacterized protein n=1 Tax=Thermogemmatispora tikiterensis TaxID=1825093 RepID=A0A328VPL5_9CHLR|nr:hypothetical protein [Thermogemmatispora tikiterensis]RAQ96135.1 hypothetical protein A4R35_11370 [Thermogemmatispora tikiterensis]